MTMYPAYGRINIFFTNAWNLFYFSMKYFRNIILPPYEINEILKQFFVLGYKSLPLVSITGFIIGLTLSLQMGPILGKFGAETLIPSMVSISIVREIGPVIIALICAGKLGSAIGAELGSMKVTEQIDAMEVSGSNPFRYLVLTRVTAVTIALPLLVIYADFLAIAGGYIAMSLEGSMGLRVYFNSAVESLGYADVIPATLKTFVFGFSIGIVGCFKGYNCSRGTESVGLAANSAVVLSSLLIIILDLIAVKITNLIV